ncbi:DEAD/DEAH box helicase [Caloranaerobacter sp. DY30410]|uniref:DEAD/DEAH box helicase n=1 Tax=Caloranaerobacter sp. DY30410 TaxID=3238305 RepID=UPI003D001044
MLKFIKRPRINIIKKYGKIGIIYDILYKDNIKVFFPLLKNNDKIIDCIIKSDHYDLINLLEELWLEDLILLDEEENYYIPYDLLYELEDDVKEKLEIPEDGKFEIKIKSYNYLGHPEFNIDYEILHPIEGKLGNYYLRYGNIIKFNDKEYLLNKAQYKLIEEIDKFEKTNDVNKQAVFIAKVKKKAEKSKAVLDEYLENEACYFPEEIDVDIKKHNDHYIELRPLFKDLNDEINSKIQGEKELKVINSYINKNKRERVFLTDKVLNLYKKINEKKDIKEADVPRFINNPQAYLPDDIDLTGFSDRVKGLKIRTYKTQPYVKAKENSEYGWFDFEVGVAINVENELFEEDGQNIENKLYMKTIETEEFKKLIEIAKKNGEDYIYYKGSWIKVDIEEGEKFLEAKEVYDKRFKNKKVSITDIPYILDIYDNLTTLEYDLTLIELKKELQNRDLLTYKKPSLLNAELYKYQQEGYLWLKILSYSRLGGLLADDMGLGKTLQVIALIAYLKEIGQLKPSIIILPSALIDNWVKEIKKFTFNITDIYIHHGFNRYKTEDIIKQYDLVLTTYETLVRDQLLLGKIDWNLIVCDEAQKIKNSNTLATTAVKALKSRYRVALTGTPVENGLSELWSIMDYVQPGLLKSYEWFKKNFEVPIQKNLYDEKLLEDKKRQLIELIHPVFLRRTKEDKLDNIPKKYEKKIRVSLSKKQEELYADIVYKVKTQGAKNKVLAYLQQLIQICSHPRLLMDEIPDTKTLLEECDKLKMVISLLNDIRLKDEKVIIFTKYRKMQNILRKVIREKFKIYPNCINGQVKGNRVNIIKEFESKKGFNVLILSPRAAGVGLNIVGANHVIHYTREWNPAIEKQATDRVYRIGQEKDVFVYYPICTSSLGVTVEERLDELLEDKKKLFKDVIIPVDKLQINEKDFTDLF